MSKQDILKGVISVLVAFVVVLCVYVVLKPTLVNLPPNNVKGKVEKNIIKYKKNSQNPVQSHIQPADEIIHIATIMIGTHYFNHGLVLIKSIVFTTKKKVNFYIFTTDYAVDKILVEIQTWPKEFKSRVNIYKLDEYKGRDLHFPLGKSNAVHKKILAYAAIMRSPIIAQRTSKLIYMDADIVALDDLWKLWEMFDTFDRNQTIAASTGRRYAIKHGEDIFRGLGINAGLMLMHLGKLKQLSFMEEYLNRSKYQNTVLDTSNDQDLLCLYFKRFPEQHQLLSCTWNFRQSMNFCTQDTKYLCMEVTELGVSIIHNTDPEFFTKSEFANVHTCMKELNFMKVYKTVDCLQNAFNVFKNDSRICDYKHNYLVNIEYVINKYYSV